MFGMALCRYFSVSGEGLSEKNVTKMCSRLCGEAGLIEVHKQPTKKLVVILMHTGSMDDVDAQASQWDQRRQFHANTLAVLSCEHGMAPQLPRITITRDS